MPDPRSAPVTVPVGPRHQTPRRPPTPGHGHRLRRPRGPDRRRRRRGHDPGRATRWPTTCSGYEDTLQVTVEDMAHHTAAVARARPRPLVVADLPWLSYHLDPVDTVRNAATLIRAGAQAVKLEGGANRVPMIEALVAAEIPVMGHLGLTPQSVNAMGGYRVQGRDDAAAHALTVGGQGHRRRRLLRRGPRGGARAGGRGHHRLARRAHHRHRGRTGLRRPGPGPPRPARAQRPRCPSSSAATPSSASGRRPRWPPTPPTCAPGPSPPTPRSTTDVRPDGRSRGPVALPVG